MAHEVSRAEVLAIGFGVINWRMLELPDDLGPTIDVRSTQKEMAARLQHSFDFPDKSSWATNDMLNHLERSYQIEYCIFIRKIRLKIKRVKLPFADFPVW